MKSIIGEVHRATIVVAAMDSARKLVMESIPETEAATILQFFAGLRGTLSVTVEERTWSVFRQLGVLPFLTLQSSSSVGIASSTSQWETETPAIGIFKLSGTSRTAI